MYNTSFRDLAGNMTGNMTQDDIYPSTSSTPSMAPDHRIVDLRLVITHDSTEDVHVHSIRCSGFKLELYETLPQEHA